MSQQCVLAMIIQWTELLGMMGYEVDTSPREWTCVEVAAINATYTFTHVFQFLLLD